MQITYAQEQLEESIFLAGPTVRPGVDLQSWRPEALRLLKEKGFKGRVFVPEMPGGGLSAGTVDQQIRWEWSALDQASVIVFWVPRDLALIPGFTTNVEFGSFDNSGKVLLGYPADAEKMRYMDRLARRYHVPVFDDLSTLLDAAIEKAANPYPPDPSARDLSF